MTVVDLFAGAGGWDCAARQLGIDPIGIEFDPDACATRAAAGLRTIRARLGQWWPTGLRRLDGLIASPPCQVFSAAGNRMGLSEIPKLINLIDSNRIGTHGSTLSRDAAHLVEPMAWIVRWMPRWVVLEQVPAVLPVWQAIARWLGRRGYHTWAGKLCAADYGDPQARERAILIARLDRPVHWPPATHAEYPQPDLFGGCPKPWVTMAQALGWDEGLMIDLRQNSRLAGGAAKSYVRSADRPASTITGQSWYQWQLDQREHYKPLQTLDRPAPTITGSATRNWAWRRPATTVACDSRIWPPGHKINQADIGRLGDTEARARYGDRAGSDAIRITPAQAAALQSFPPDWPWQGNKTSVGRQIGNAIPVRMAHAILQEATQ